VTLGRANEYMRVGLARIVDNRRNSRNEVPSAVDVCSDQNV
jgi:hypothetical protein